MRWAWLILLLTNVLAGCSWDPKRDNPVDPNSPYYAPPPQPNRAPHIDTVLVRTHKQWSEVNPFYSFEIVAYVSDPDRNINYSAVFARVDTFPLGPMSFDPNPGEFTVHRSQVDFPNEDLNQLVGTVVRVTAFDDSAASDESSILFPTPLGQPEPQISYPEGSSSDPVSIVDDSVRLGWQLWSGPGGEHRFSISVLYKNIFLDWDTTGLMPSDTFVVVTDTLRPASIDPSIYYTWYLTVTDDHGNSITSLPGYFRYFPPGRATAGSDPEESTSR